MTAKWSALYHSLSLLTHRSHSFAYRTRVVAVGTRTSRPCAGDDTRSSSTRGTKEEE